ncbi:MAG: thioredoxin fold domain-containing protein [Gammaproteobacteria bacterium]|nr:thioredoxin fold domain-containing protein [Gammaproteobacteria bacterium]
MNRASFSWLWLVAAMLLGASLPVSIAQADVSAVSDDELYTPDGYRGRRYRAVLPDAPPAGQRIDTPALKRLIETDNPVLVDVQAVTVRPESAEFGVSWLPGRTRYHLPGSTWLPNVGYGHLDIPMHVFFATNLARLTAGDKGRAVVFYCVIDCWMSWNAVKRADALGYRNIYWYAEGTDGWAEAGLPLVPAQPRELAAGSDTKSCDTDVSAGGFFDCREVSLPEALAQVAADPALHAVLLFVEGKHCPFCKRMRRVLLPRPEIIEQYRSRFVVLSLDIESKARFIGADGQSQTEAGYARDAIGVYRTPTMVFLDADGDEIYRHAGIVIDPTIFLSIADYVEGGHWQHQGFRDYLKTRRDAD